jgi:hemolysin-activating ACP:hemolysin acyltransferase
MQHSHYKVPVRTAATNIAPVIRNGEIVVQKESINRCN